MHIHSITDEAFIVITHEYMISLQEPDIYQGRTMEKSLARKTADFFRSLFGYTDNTAQNPFKRSHLRRISLVGQVHQTQAERVRELRDTMLRFRDEITSSFYKSTTASGCTLLLPAEKMRKKMLAYAAFAFDEHYAPYRRPRTPLNSLKHDKHFLRASEAADAITCDFLREEKCRPADIAWLEATSRHVHKRLEDFIFAKEDRPFDAIRNRMLRNREHLQHQAAAVAAPAKSSEAESPCEFEKWLADGGADRPSFSNGPKYGVVTNAVISRRYSTMLRCGK
jgi:hypothetical protein